MKKKKENRTTEDDGADERDDDCQLFQAKCNIRVVGHMLVKIL